MSYDILRVKPDRKYTAEVIILVTTLRSKRGDFNACRRLMEFLEIKRCHFKTVDMNQDAQVSPEQYEKQVMTEILKEKRLKYFEYMVNEDDGTQRKVVTDEPLIPQIFIDGINAGGLETLMSQEDQKDKQGLSLFDHKLTRKGAPKAKKHKEWLPGVWTIDEKIAQIESIEGDGAGGGDDSSSSSEDDDSPRKK